MMEYLTPQQILFIHHLLIETTGRSHGVLDLGALQSAADGPAGYKMILHCTEKLAAKLPATPAEGSAVSGPLGDWHANLYQVDRRQCVLFCHDQTRYMLFLPGLKKPHFESLERLHRDLFILSLAGLGLPDGKIMRARLALGPLAVARVTDRSVLGSMKIGMQDLGNYLARFPNLLEIDPAATARFLNHRPVSVRRAWHWPDREMQAQVERL